MLGARERRKSDPGNVKGASASLEETVIVLEGKLVELGRVVGCNEW